MQVVGLNRQVQHVHLYLLGFLSNEVIQLVRGFFGYADGLLTALVLPERKPSRSSVT